MARKNLIERAGRIKDQKKAVRLIADALGIDVSDVRYKFSPQEFWSKREPWSRINEIELWLVSECRAAMKLGMGMTPMQTVGTND